MLMQQRLGLKLAQKPVLTQSLRQLVKLLALNKLELKEEINQELTENPVLELASDAATEASLDEAVAETAERSGAERPEQEGATEQPEPAADGAEAFAEIDLGAFFDDYLDPGPRGPASEVIDKPSFETFLSKPTTLTDHLMWQLSLTAVNGNVSAAAEAIVRNLDEDGYLTTDLEEIARESAAAPEEVERALRIVQEMDPLGVAARDLQDCLLIQLRAEDAEEGVAGAIVRDCWGLLEDGASNEEIAEVLGRPLEHIEIALDVIRHLDPKPGQRYAVSETRTVEPDVQFIRSPDGFRVALNEDDMPDLRLNRSYRALLKRGQSTTEVRNYIRPRYNPALQSSRNIEQRRQTIHGVCDAIVRRQPGFLADGIEHLRPMMIKDVAEEIGVHPSTVSRAVANKYALTPHGVYELRFFFTEGVQGPSGAAMPLLLLKRKVKKMIDEEDPRKPLTDDKLSQMLRKEGVHVARRTVAKYREDLNIPSTHRRRRKK